MLIDIDTGKVKDRVPFQHDFDALRGRLSDAEFDAMVARINELIDETGSEIATAGWLPGSDWTGTPFEPIYAKAARGDFDRSAMFFGQLVWYAVMTRPLYPRRSRDRGRERSRRCSASGSVRVGHVHREVRTNRLPHLIDTTDAAAVRAPWRAVSVGRCG